MAVMGRAELSASCIKFNLTNSIAGSRYNKAVALLPPVAVSTPNVDFRSAAIGLPPRIRVRYRVLRVSAFRAQPRITDICF
jgi:hypothetical protein